MNEDWWSYVQRVSGHSTNKDIAAAAGCDPSTVSHWKNGERPRADVVVSLARAYSRSPQEALIVAGYLTEDDLAQPVTSTGLTQCSDSELSAEIQRRMAMYGDVVAEMRRRLEADDPRRIEPGSAGDIFPSFSDDVERRGRNGG